MYFIGERSTKSREGTNNTIKGRHLNFIGDKTKRI